MIDFTDMPTRKKAYAGANGGKIAIVYEGEQYMLKFPPRTKRNKEMSYTNSCISEYLIQLQCKWRRVIVTAVLVTCMSHIT